jgi:hypothetical protein
VVIVSPLPISSAKGWQMRGPIRGRSRGGGALIVRAAARPVCLMSIPFPANGPFTVQDHALNIAGSAIRNIPRGKFAQNVGRQEDMKRGSIEG